MNTDAAADPFRFHGGRLAAAAARFAGAPTPWIDLSTGISPWAYPVPDMDQPLYHRLPEPEKLRALEDAAAHAFGVADSDEVVAVPGSDIAIRLLAVLFPGQRSAMLTPIFAGHKAAWPDAAEINVEEADTVSGKYDLLILANPNNPDGRIMSPDRLRALHGQLIVDEAFADTDPATSLLPDKRGAIVLRSFGKFFGLAGIRLGFVVADIAVAQRLRNMLGDWPVSGAAIEIGLAAYQDKKWQDDHRRALNKAASRLDAMLETGGLAIVGGTSLFRLAAHDRAGELFEHLGRAGILVRPFNTDERQLRFGLPANEVAWERLSSALKDWQ
ncbi:threonine-phosphate decarboxylase CobD [Parasphingorhabdus sp. JC815]|uniref:threonine-phosphate decarboxylase CobD n=1 Tax=Parasphingorhabdus sp. JC815 TaxID=3232140 RepID=UPI0034578096